MTPAERRKYLDDLVPLVARVMQLNGAGAHEEALALITDLQARAGQVDCQSALLLWQRSIAADGLKQWADAVQSISQALSLDPWPAPFLGSGRIIRDRVIEQAQDYPVEDSRVAALCLLLIDNLEVLPNVHILYARHLLAVGKVEDAAAQVDAAMAMDANLLDGWMLRAAIARQRGGNEAEGFAAEFESHLLRTGTKAEA